jgi:hypothetical protein
MHSEIEVGNAQISALTSGSRAMTGQSPYVVNAGLTFSPSGSRRSATVLYNVAGERIAAVGSKPVLDTYELARHMLDVAIQFPAYRDLMARVNAKNLFDAPVKQTSGEVTRIEYRTGRIFQLGFTWQVGGAP